jgi:uncharacterized protein DUF3631
MLLHSKKGRAKTTKRNSLAEKSIFSHVSEATSDKLIDREGEPWALWWERDIEDANMKGPASRLARLLKPFGIIPRTIREPDGTTPKGYPLAAFNDAFACYLPPFYSPPPVI